MTTALIVTTLLFAGLGAYMYYTYKRIKNTPEVDPHSAIKELNDKNFQSQVKSGVTLVDFWAAWCMPCKMMAPILNDVATDIGDTATVAKLDVETNRAASATYGVRNIPTMILFKNGKEVNRFVGVKQRDFLVKEIRKVL